MKIENLGINPLGNSNKPEGTSPVDKKSTVDSSSSAADSKDKAVLSGKARLLAKARVAINDIPEMRMDRVSALQQQINSGNYTVPYEELARRVSSRLRLW